MSDLLAGVLAALISTNTPVATSNLVREHTGISIAIPDPNDPVEKEYRNLVADDDAAAEEVEKWTDAANAAAAAGDSRAQTTLHFRVQQRLDGVKEKYEDFVRLHPDHVRALLAYGGFLRDAGDTAGARTQWEKASQLAPNNPAAWDDLGTIYEEGDVPKAFECFSKAIELDGSQAVYYHNLAAAVYLFRKEAAEHWKLSDQEVYDLSLALYRRALKLAPDDFVLASDYAECFYGISPPRWQEGLAAWNQCLELARDEVEREGVRVHLARINLALSNFEETRRNLDAITNGIYAKLKSKISSNLDAAMQTALTNGPPQPLR
jgi:tetratricopeptide (TPR) repeat protein